MSIVDLPVKRKFPKGKKKAKAAQESVKSPKVRTNADLMDNN